MHARLLHYGQPVAIAATLRHGRRIWWATPLQHRLLVNCLYHSGLTTRQRAAMLGCSQHAVVQNLRSWTRKGVLRYKVTGRGRAARSEVFLCASVPPLHKPMNEPTNIRRGCISLGKVTTRGHVMGGLIHSQDQCACVGRAPSQWCYDGALICECAIHHKREATTWCYLEGVDKPVAHCYEQGCPVPSFMGECLGTHHLPAVPPPSAEKGVMPIDSGIESSHHPSPPSSERGSGTQAPASWRELGRSFGRNRATGRVPQKEDK